MVSWYEGRCGWMEQVVSKFSVFYVSSGYSCKQISVSATMIHWWLGFSVLEFPSKRIWLCCDTYARVIWWMIQFWSAWSNHDDLWHVRDVHFPHLCWFKSTWMFFLYVLNNKLAPPRWAHITYNCAAETAAWLADILQVHGASHPSLFGASGSICMVPGRNWFSELFQDEIARSCIISKYLLDMMQGPRF